MKVLFAVSNENISESIVKKYQKDYKEIISYKNVYYFNAILKEIQKDKSYDRIVISEDLEPFANNNYEQIDRFIFDKLDGISDEAENEMGEDIPIILICSDRRSKAESILIKLFGIGIYSALLGQDRSIDAVCKLINRPRSKKDAKQYYKIDSEDVNYQAENENEVSEEELQNILNHYKKLGKNEERYVDSFNNIVSQYNDIQLKLIISHLPIKVRAVLEAESPKYQELVTFNPKFKNKPIKNIPEKNEKKDITASLIGIETKTKRNTKPVVIPTAINTSKPQRLTKKADNINSDLEEKNKLERVSSNEIDNNDEITEPVKRGRGRPKKIVSDNKESLEGSTIKRGRGRPKKTNDETIESLDEKPVKRGRGRPKKVTTEEEEIDLFALSQDDENVLPNFEDIADEKVADDILPGFDEEDFEDILPGFEEEEEEDEILPGFEEQEEEEEQQNNSYSNRETSITKNVYNDVNSTVDTLLTKDKKLVAFVGTTKAGTSFIINNLAELSSSMGIKTAILDTTENRNSYYIYTKNEDTLRTTAFSCFKKLRSGIPEGIKVNKNLTVFTSLPDPENKKELNDYDNILSTLVQNYSLVLIDCDFNTPVEYFAKAQEIYLVQSMDVLTIQPLTAFLRDLKAKNVLKPAKLRAIINKEAKVRSITIKTIIGGMSYYNDPAMSFMTELFDRNTIKYISIPFDINVYERYLEGLVNCNISINGYPKMFIAKLKELASIVYPMLPGVRKKLFFKFKLLKWKNK